ncbi:MAG: hypothetical protein EHM70_01415 [Chloroflexota bacterium]|nr:MAG: hypothetical protein EHM70_01415 [Chloroflexota bacterium]
MKDHEVEAVPQIEAILAKKAEGRPVTPEEYQVLSQFVDRIERGLIRQRQAELRAKEEKTRTARSLVPEAAFTMPLDSLQIADRIRNLLAEAGYTNVGDLIFQLSTDSDAILGLSGIGPRAMQEIEKAIAEIAWPAPAEEVQAEEVTEAVAAEPEVAEEPVVAEAAEAVVVEPQEEAPVEAEAVVEVVEAAETAPAEGAQPVEAAQAEAEAQPVEQAPEAVESQREEEEMPSSLDEIFALKPEILDIPSDDEEEEEDERGKPKKKKKKKKFVEMEYDPEKDAVIVKKKRKRGGAVWDDNWDV